MEGDPLRYLYKNAKSEFKVFIKVTKDLHFACMVDCVDWKRKHRIFDSEDGMTVEEWLSCYVSCYCTGDCCIFSLLIVLNQDFELTNVASA